MYPKSALKPTTIIESPLGEKFHDVSAAIGSQKSKGQRVETKASGDSIVGT
jgi:hypothetical protein